EIPRALPVDHEVLALAEWCQERSDDATNDGEIGFIQPNISFQWSKGSLRVVFALECLPSWAPRDEPDEFHIGFAPSPDELASAVSSLRADLLKYPIRPD